MASPLDQVSQPSVEGAASAFGWVVEWEGLEPQGNDTPTYGKHHKNGLFLVWEDPLRLDLSWGLKK